MQPTFSEAGTAFLQRLRTETGPMHRQLEQSALSTALMQPGVTLENYSTYLSYMRNIIAWSEEHIFPQVQHLVNTTDRYKLALIDADLAVLNTKALAVPFSLPVTISGIPEAMGSLYVIEGSTLGGNVILKHITAQLPVTAEYGGSFFNGYGAETGKQWNLFLQFFTQYITDIHGENAAIEAAQQTFTSIDQYFQQ